MKHVFTVHSPITFLMTLSIIKMNDIDQNDIVVLCSGYEPPIVLPYFKKSFQSLNRNFIHKILNWNTPKEYDKYINSFLKEDENYVAYIDLMHMHQRILVTNKKCVEFSFFEEGTESYVYAKKIVDVGNIFNKNTNRYNKFSDNLPDIRMILRGYGLNLISMPFDPINYRGVASSFYCLSDAAYPGINIANKKICNLKDLNLDSVFPQSLTLSNQLIWIEETFTYAFEIPEFEYEHAIKATINKLSTEFVNKTIFIKKRPCQKDSDSLVYKILLQNGSKVEIIADNIVLEIVLQKSENCLLIGNVSSLLFYGKLFGHESYSMFNLIQNKPKTIFDTLDFYWDAVTKL